MVRSYYEFFGQSPQDQITARIERAFWAQKEEEAKQRKLFPRLQNDLLYLAALEKYELIEKITDYQAAVATGFIKTLDFSHNKLSYLSNSMVYKIYKIMSNMLYKTSIEKLTLWNNHFGKEHNNALRAILLLTKDSSVKFLDLGHNYIGYMNQGDISSILSIFKNLNITHINLSNNHLGRLDVSNLLILLDLLTIGTKITHIDISSNALCEMNCTLLRNFDFSLKYAIRSLHYLNLSHTGLYNRGIHYAILDWISNSNVEHLDLSHSGLWQFTTENLHRLFKKLEKTNVSNLNISDNKLCYTGSSANLKAILQALNNSQVYKINLSGNNLLLIKPGFLIEIFQQIPSNKYYHFTFDIQDMNQYGASALYKLLSERVEHNQFIFEISFSFNRSNPKHNILFELQKALRYEFMYNAGDISQDDFAKALHYINILQILRNMEDELLFHHYFPNITHHITYTSHEHIEDYATSDNDQYLRLSMLKTLRSNGQIPHGLKTQYANKFHDTIGDILHNTRYDKESKQLMMSEILSFISYDDMKAILNSACIFCYITEQESVDAIMQSTI